MSGFQVGEEVSSQGMVFDIENFAVHDGPGIRTAVFMKGCPLRCLWCHNPESQAFNQELTWIRRNCIGCGDCIKICRHGALVAQPLSGYIDILREKCQRCFKCVSACPAKAMVTIGQLVTVDEVFSKILKNESFFRHSGGGVTVTGGEPLGQWKFVRKLLHRCREAGVHTALDTCGYASWEHLKAALEYTDIVLYDVKEMDPLKHERFTGVSNELILENLRRISSFGAPFVVRVPLIPGFTSTEENIHAVGKFLCSLDNLYNLAHVELLPYHRLGETKYKWIDQAYLLEGVKAPSSSEMKVFESILRDMGLKVQVGG